MSNARAMKMKLKASPLGEFKVAFLDAPSKKFGKFSAVLALETDATTPKGGKTILDLKTELENFLEEYVAAAIAETPKLKAYKARRLPIAPEIDEETGDETGRWLLKASQAEKITLKSGEVRTMSVDLFDSSGKPMKGKAVGRGSTGRIAGTVKGYASAANSELGLTIYLEGAKILSLVDPRGGTAESYGFDDEEEGFEIDDSDVSVGLDEDEGGDDEGSGDGDF